MLTIEQLSLRQYSITATSVAESLLVSQHWSRLVVRIASLRGRGKIGEVEICVLADVLPISVWSNPTTASRF